MSCVSPSSLIVGGVYCPPPDDLNLRNHQASGVAAFAGTTRRAKDVHTIVVHESVTRSVNDTVAVLQRRGYGVHLIVGPDGAVTQHADLTRTRLVHAGIYNASSVGLELVNPYYPSSNAPGSAWTKTLDAPWAHQGKYVVPTLPQVEAATRLLAWLTSGFIPGLSIPRQWPGVTGGVLGMGLVKGLEKPTPGIVAHHYFNHADGAWPVLYAWLRLEAGLPPQAAYAEALSLAEGATRRVDIQRWVSAGAEGRWT